MRSGYKLFRQFNAGAGFDVGSRNPIGPGHVASFGGDSLQDRLARSLAEERAVPVKEVFESFEFFGRVRKYVRGPVVADLCAGHGLTGVLFAAFERSVQQVHLIDRRRPPSADRVLAAVARVAPWVTDKVSWSTCDLESVGAVLPRGCSVIAVHACGLKTDRSLEVALEAGGPVAVMPCCYHDVHCDAPRTLVQHLGGDLAYDIDRTYRLECAGYEVRWDAIPAEITPMARVLIARPGAQARDVEGGRVAARAVTWSRASPEPPA